MFQDPIEVYHIKPYFALLSSTSRGINSEAFRENISLHLAKPLSTIERIFEVVPLSQLEILVEIKNKAIWLQRENKWQLPIEKHTEDLSSNPKKT